MKKEEDNIESRDLPGPIHFSFFSFLKEANLKTKKKPCNKKQKNAPNARRWCFLNFLCPGDSGDSLMESAKNVWRRD